MFSQIIHKTSCVCARVWVHLRACVTLPEQCVKDDVWIWSLKTASRTRWAHTKVSLEEQEERACHECNWRTIWKAEFNYLTITRELMKSHLICRDSQDNYKDSRPPCLTSNESAWVRKNTMLGMRFGSGMVWIPQKNRDKSIMEVIIVLPLYERQTYVNADYNKMKKKS